MSIASSNVCPRYGSRCRYYKPLAGDNDVLNSAYTDRLNEIISADFQNRILTGRPHRDCDICSASIHPMEVLVWAHPFATKSPVFRRGKIFGRL